MKTIFALCIAAVGVIIASISIANNTSSIPAISSTYTVHEWGTFTSVFGSDGKMLTGLEIEEETLPPFVYAHDGMNGKLQLPSQPTPKDKLIVMMKGFQRPLHNVTVKMETPVLYFYSPKKFKAHVRVGFKGGSISQWYPARSGGETPPPTREIIDGVLASGAIDFGGKPYQGSIEWDFTVEPRNTDTAFAMMKSHETANWIHPRAPQSSVLKTPNGDSESYLFYRGIGNFELPLSFKVSEDRKLTIQSNEAIPYLMVVEISGGNVRVLSEGSVKNTLSIDIDQTGKPAPMDQMRLTIYQHLKAALVEAGLFEDEAAAMLRTWWNSYFGREGIRAFWIVPRDFTDRILPIEIDPVPEKLERVLLGRSEILTPKFETDLIKAFKNASEQNGKPNNPYAGDRYAKAYALRVKALVPDLAID